MKYIIHLARTKLAQCTCVYVAIVSGPVSICLAAWIITIITYGLSQSAVLCLPCAGLRNNYHKKIDILPEICDYFTREYTNIFRL